MELEKPNESDLVDVESVGKGYQVVRLNLGREEFLTFNGKRYNDVFLTIFSAIKFIKDEMAPKLIALSPSEFEKLESKNWERAIETMMHDYNVSSKNCVYTNYNGVKIIPVTITI